ncbi:hypothetical protein ACFYO2_46965 [Streptomyces sp. NPDC006602]
MQLESILAAADPGSDVEDLEDVFARLARESQGIQDIALLLEDAS